MKEGKGSKKDKEKEERTREALDLVMETPEALAEERSAEDKIGGAMVKQTLKRRALNAVGSSPMGKRIDKPGRTCIYSQTAETHPPLAAVDATLSMIAAIGFPFRENGRGEKSRLCNGPQGLVRIQGHLACGSRLSQGSLAKARRHTTIWPSAAFPITLPSPRFFLLPIHHCRPARFMPTARGGLRPRRHP